MDKRKRDIKMNVNDNIKDISIFIDDGINLENFTGKKKLELKKKFQLN